MLSVIKKVKNWLGTAESDHIKKRNYNTYDDYLSHQKEKTLDPVRREKWLGEEWEPKLNYFKNEYLYIKDKFNLKFGNKGLGLGARTGQEVQAMIDIGMTDSLGIDLVDNPPLVIEGDIHNLKFEDNTYDFLFTNIYDHALYPEKFLKEMVRVLNSGGIGMIHLQVGMVTDDYGVVDITSTKSIEVSLRDLGAEIVGVEEIKNRDVIDMSTRLIFRKK